MTRKDFASKWEELYGRELTEKEKDALNALLSQVFDNNMTDDEIDKKGKLEENRQKERINRVLYERERFKLFKDKVLFFTQILVGLVLIGVGGYFMTQLGQLVAGFLLASFGLMALRVKNADKLISKVDQFIEK